MLRAIGAAIAGYVVMAVVVFAGLSIVWMLLGPGGAFEPESWATSMKWNLGYVVVGIIAALAGGYLCALISPGGRSLVILVGIVVVLGGLSAAAALMQPAPMGPRPEVVTMFDAMGNARQPVWTVILNPIVGVVGAVLGSRLRGRPATGA